MIVNSCGSKCGIRFLFCVNYFCYAVVVCGRSCDSRLALRVVMRYVSNTFQTSWNCGHSVLASLTAPDFFHLRNVQEEPRDIFLIDRLIDWLKLLEANQARGHSENRARSSFEIEVNRFLQSTIRSAFFLWSMAVLLFCVYRKPEEPATTEASVFLKCRFDNVGDLTVRVTVPRHMCSSASYRCRTYNSQWCRLSDFVARYLATLLSV